MPVVNGPERWAGPPVDDSGGPPDNGGMDTTLFATKADLSDLRADMKISAAELRESFAELRADMHKVDSEHKKWIMTTVLSVMGTGVAVAGFLFATLRDKPQPPQPAQAPIIITLPSQAAPPAAK